MGKLSADELNITVGQSVTNPVTAVRNLGVLIDTELSMRDHVSRLAQTCFSLTQSTLSASSVGQDVTERLVCALVLSRLDYCNVVLAGLPTSTLAPLQRVLRVAARVMLDLKPRDHISSALRELHWLSISERVVYKLCFLVPQGTTWTVARLHHRLIPASRCHFIPVLAADASRGDYVVPRTNRKMADRAFSSAEPRERGTSCRLN